MLQCCCEKTKCQCRDVGGKLSAPDDQRAESFTDRGRCVAVAYFVSLQLKLAEMMNDTGTVEKKETERKRGVSER